MRVRIKVYGLVQSVFFRFNTKEKADELGLKGWVRNKGDGSVEILTEGTDEKVKELVKWCKDGPGMSRVDKVEVEEDVTKEKLRKFEIKY